MTSPYTVRRSALFVDFDNVYAGLADIERTAAESFATNPDNWVRALAEGEDDSGLFQRRFLVRNCYLNPVTHRRYRPFFTRSGFRVIDCPPLTTRQKNSADIHMVVDILDALGHPTTYEEFVVASADADFTPVMLRLRAHDRRTAIVIGGHAAAAYRSVCDAVISPDALVAAVAVPSELTLPIPEPPLTEVTPGVDQSPPPSGAGTIPAQEAPLDETAPEASAVDEAVLAAIRLAVASAPHPLVLAGAAQAALEVDPTLPERAWGGAGKFTPFVARYLPELRHAQYPSPGYLYDPARHSVADIARAGTRPTNEHLDPLPAQVSLVTNAPPLSSEHYGILFEELAADVLENGFDHRTVKRVRDRVHLRETPISRHAVAFVVQSMVSSHEKPTAGASARRMAESWSAVVEEMCANAQMVLSEQDLDEVRRWIVGALPADAANDPEAGTPSRTTPQESRETVDRLGATEGTRGGLS